MLHWLGILNRSQHDGHLCLIALELTDAARRLDGEEARVGAEKLEVAVGIIEDEALREYAHGNGKTSGNEDAGWGEEEEGGDDEEEDCVEYKGDGEGAARRRIDVRRDAT